MLRGSNSLAARVHNVTCCCQRPVQVRHLGNSRAFQRMPMQALPHMMVLQRLAQPATLLQQQRRVHAQAVQVDLLLGGIAGVPGWVLGGILLLGVLLGLTIAKMASNQLRKEVDLNTATLENAELRTKVEELQQLILNLQPLAYKSMRLRFTKGINKAVILGMVDQMLANKEVNIWWLPDAIERVFYFNMMTLMMSVLDEVVDGMSIGLAGHNVRLELTYLDVAPDGEAASNRAQKTEALMKHAMQPTKAYTNPTPESPSSQTSGR